TNVDWAGKTGTSQNWEDAWFVASNPNVTFGTWTGYKTPKSLNCPSCSLSYSQQNIKLWAEMMNTASDIDPELLAPKEKFKKPDGIVSKKVCAVSGLLPSEACSKAGLTRTDIFNSKFVPEKKDDSLIKGGNTVKVNGKTVAAGSKTPKEFVPGKGLSFNPDFLKRKNYDRFDDLSVLFPRTNREAWEKIGTSGKVSSDKIKDDKKAPSAPSALKKSGSSLSWGKSSSSDVVGYRIFKKNGDKYSLVGHTTDRSYKVSDKDAGYIVKAVDYFGRESEGSNAIKPSKEKEEKVDKDDKDKEKEKEKEDKDKA